MLARQLLNFTFLATLSCVVGLQALCSQPARQYDISLPQLRTGAYVEASITCSQGSNATLQWYNGEFFSAGRMNNVIPRLVAKGIYTANVKNWEDGRSEKVRIAVLSSTLYEMDGARFKFCPEQSLAPDWRNSTPPRISLVRTESRDAGQRATISPTSGRSASPAAIAVVGKSPDAVRLADEVALTRRIVGTRWYDQGPGCASISKSARETGVVLRAWYCEADESSARKIVMDYDRTVGMFVHEETGLLLIVNSTKQITLLARGKIADRLGDKFYISEEKAVYLKQ